MPQTVQCKIYFFKKMHWTKKILFSAVKSPLPLYALDNNLNIFIMSGVAKRENLHWHRTILTRQQSCPVHFRFFSGTGQKHREGCSIVINEIDGNPRSYKILITYSYQLSNSINNWSIDYQSIEINIYQFVTSGHTKFEYFFRVTT